METSTCVYDVGTLKESAETRCMPRSRDASQGRLRWLRQLSRTWGIAQLKVTALHRVLDVMSVGAVVVKPHSMTDCTGACCVEESGKQS